MKKVYTFFLLTVTFAFSVQYNAQSYVLDWAHGCGDSFNQFALANAVDGQGNVYTTGVFMGAFDFDPGPGTYTMSTPGTPVVYVQKLDANGNFQWAIQLETTSNGNSGSSIAIDGLNNVYITGSFGGTGDFDPGPGTATASTNGSNDAYIWKLNSSGALLWFRTFGGAGTDVGSSISFNASNNVYVTGYFVGTVDFDPGPGISTGTSNGGIDFFIAKFDVSGNFGWSRTIGSAGADEPKSIVTNASGDAYVCGSFNNTVDFDAGPSTSTLAAVGSTDAFVVKYSAVGNFLWARTFGGPLGDAANSIDLTSTGDVITGGAFQGTVDFDTGPSTFTSNSNGSSDAFIHKIDASGNFQWVKTFGGTGGNDRISALKIDPSGHILSTGVYRGNVDFDPGVGSFSLAAVSVSELFLHKLDGTGNFSWAGTLSSNTSTSSNVSTGITTNSSGNIYLCGYYVNAVDFDPGANTSTLTAVASAYDFFAAKYSPCIAPNSPSNTTLSDFLTICDGNAASLSAASTGSVNWYSSATSTNIIITANNFSTPTLSTGTYTYYADANTCTVSANRTAITVTVNPNPTITAVSSNTTFCAGESVTITASGASVSSYSWSTNTLSQSIVISPTTTTSYTVHGSLLGCTSSATITQVVEECVGLSRNSLEQKILRIYPNPVIDILNITSESKVREVEIADITGKIISKFSFDRDSNNQEVNLKYFPSGLYSVTIKTEVGTVNFKLIK